ncbi:MAG: Rieske 2Fe-2S domain-containing protein [Candidatus Binataceae bacterium]
MFMQNAWYAAAWGHELGRNPLARRICDHPIVMYRLENGAPCALEDLCCHRLLPLSHGRLEGDLLVCGYHGLSFDKTGQCVLVPSQNKLNRNLRVRNYPIVERHRLLWLWIGDPALADPSTVPDFHWNDDPEWASSGGMLAIACDYRLLIDNLLDLSHETYIHPGSLGHELIPGTPIETKVDGDVVTVSRWIMDHEPAPFWRAMMQRARGYTGRCDRWQIVNFVPPSNAVLNLGVAEANSGAPDGNLSKGIRGMQLNSLTPATPHTSWYFFSFCRNFCLEDEELTKRTADTVYNIFQEDKIIVEAQQRAMLENPDVRGININLDAGRVRVWRMIEERSHLVRPSAA